MGTLKIIWDLVSNYAIYIYFNPGTLKERDTVGRKRKNFDGAALLDH